MQQCVCVKMKIVLCWHNNEKRVLTNYFSRQKTDRFQRVFLLMNPTVMSYNILRLKQLLKYYDYIDLFIHTDVRERVNYIIRIYY